MAKKTLDKKTIEYSSEIKELIEKINKNLSFGKENNCLSEFEEGGKYFGSFNKLVKDTANKVYMFILDTAISLNVLPMKGFDEKIAAKAVTKKYLQDIFNTIQKGETPDDIVIKVSLEFGDVATRYYIENN